MMKYSRSVQSSAAAFSLAIAGVAASFQANASSVTVDYIGLEKGGNFTAYYNGSSMGSGSAGLFKWTMVAEVGDDLIEADAGQTFYTFCIEFVEHIKDNNQVYNLVDQSLAPELNGTYPAMGTAKADLMEKWFGSYYDDVLAGSHKEAMAFQMGLWEIVYEDLALIGANVTDIDSSSGNGRFELDSSNETADTLVETWFGNNWKSAEQIDLIALSAPSGVATVKLQDQITVAAPAAAFVPSPVAIIPGTAGLIFLVGRRRRSRA